MKDWVLKYEKYRPEKEGAREALCALGNGYFVLRGAGEESVADGTHYPGTYLAGGYNRARTEIDGQTIESEDLVNFPNPLPLRFRIPGEDWFDLSRVEILDYQQMLNLQEGVLSRKVRFADQKGRRTVVGSRRFVSMRHPHQAVMELNIRPEDWGGEIEIESALDGRIENSGVERYQQLCGKHLEVREITADDEHLFLRARTRQSKIVIAQAARTRLFAEEKRILDAAQEHLAEAEYAATRYRVHLKHGQSVRVEKIIAMYTSRDRGVSEAGLEARRSVREAEDFIGLLQRHRMAWKHLWRRFDTEIRMREGADADTPLILRLNMFHILQTSCLNSLDLDVGVPPRGWHGEAYRGHISWDELFAFLTFNLQYPELTRQLLMYRYRRLPAARRAAKEAGYAGAMYPWQSGSDGREEGQKIHLNPESGEWVPDHCYLQRHVSSAIAYNIWQHHEATEDAEFLNFYGAEMLVEIARFWSSMAKRNSTTGRYEICGVIGPDQFHEKYPGADEPGLRNNAYTNVMAAWVLTRALEALDVISPSRRVELAEILRLRDEEFERWDRVRRKLYIPFHGDGVISQFEGYDQLEELDWKKYEGIQRLDRVLQAQGDDPNRYKVSKQADVLMLFFLFSIEELRTIFRDMGYDLSRECVRATVDYYCQRTVHASSLSGVVYSWVLARSDRKASWKFFRKALMSDIGDIQRGTTSEGIHLGAMAGTVDLLVRCYLGLETRGYQLRFNPGLPDEVESVRTRLRYHGHSLSIKIGGGKLWIHSEHVAASEIRISCGTRCCRLRGKEEIEIPI